MLAASARFITLAPRFPSLAVGPAPLSPESFEVLQTRGVTHLLSLQSDADLSRFALTWSSLWQLLLARGIHAMRVPIVDFDKSDFARTLPDAVLALESLLPDPDTTAHPARLVYVHCTAGINRSTTVVLAYLAKRIGLDAAYALLMEAHPDAIPYRDVVAKWLKKQR